MQNNKRLIFTLLLYIFSTNSRADFHVEPSYSFVTGSFDDGTDKGSFRANVMAIKTGYIDNNIFLGLNFEIGDYDFDNDFSTFGVSKYKGGGVGTYLGFYYGSFKIWTTYLNSSLEPTGQDDERYFGQQFSYAIGYKIGGSFFLSYELFANTYTQLENDVTGKTQSLSQHLKTQGQAIVVSAQWALF